MKHQHCVIIGGTSGIGLALARWHLSQGWQVTVVGSSAAKITGLQQSIISDSFDILSCDLQNTTERMALLADLNNHHIDRLIYSAGYYYNERRQKLNKTESAKVLAINLQAFCDVFYHISEQLKSQHGKSQMVALASVAGLLDFKDSSLYAKCKQAMITTCQAYRMALVPFDIDVICIASGYVDTLRLRELNHGTTHNKPFVISEEQAVFEIMRAIDNNIALHVFPKVMKYTTWALSLLPKHLLNSVMKFQYRHQDKHKT